MDNSFPPKATCPPAYEHLGGISITLEPWDPLEREGQIPVPGISMSQAIHRDNMSNSNSENFGSLLYHYYQEKSQLD